MASRRTANLVSRSGCGGLGGFQGRAVNCGEEAVLWAHGNCRIGTIALPGVEFSGGKPVVRWGRFCKVLGPDSRELRGIW